ncbi:BTAD domain-containing putative transcriptional regulator [Saccharothrix syringae]|uniref:BTAD domain-containing putative transcriptional regulator n=1 Tax=Saccharothrix syringae TaxID=103733 RepID=UPI000691B6D2|nr:BTAD domain-containing putative transcriptional regulator [Saccharothrix syringae]
MLGALRVWSGDEEVAVGSNRQRAVLALLASRPDRNVTRAELVDGVWGEDAPASAVGNLHTYVSGLRSALGQARDLLRSTGTGYSLRLPATAVDREVFTAAHADARRRYAAGDLDGALSVLDEALALWRGEAYADVDCPFADAARAGLAEARLAAVVLRARARLGLDDAGRGDLADLVAELTALVREHPADEALHEVVVLALHRAGRHAEAVEALGTARAALARFGLRPGPALRELHDRVLAPPEPSREPTPLLYVVPSEVTREAPGRLVGRDGELAELAAAVDGVGEDCGGVVWVEGEAGIGKSALLRAALAGVGARGFQLTWGVADEFSGRFPLQVFVECCGATPTSPDPRLADLGEQLQKHRQRWWHHTATVDRLLAFVVEVCAAAPLVLVVDDIQWADDASLLLWRKLVEVTRRHPLLLVAACRPGAGTGEQSSLRAAAAAAGGRELELKPLGQRDTEQVVRDLVGDAVEADVVRDVAARSGGNPLYARVLAEAFTREGARRATGDDVPPSLDGPVDGVLAHLTDAARDVLRWAALLGVRFAVGDLVAVAGPARHLLTALDEAMAAGVVVEAGGALAFRHPVLREVVHGKIAVPVRLALHRQAAEALARAGAPVERVAGQLLAAQPAADGWTASWLVANREALAGRAPLLAARLAERVLDSGVAGEARPDLLATLAGVRFRLARDGEAEAAAQEALVLAEDPALAAEMRHLLALLRHRQGDTAEAVSQLEAALKEPDAPNEWRARHRSLIATILRGGLLDLDEAEAAATRQYTRAMVVGNTCAAAYAMQTKWIVATMRGDHEQALRCADEAHELFKRRSGAVESRCDVLDNRATSLHHLDRVDEAWEALREARELAAEHGLPPSMQLPVAVHHYWTGRWDSALVELHGVTRDSPGLTFHGVRELDAALLRLHGLAALIAARRDEEATTAVHLDLAMTYAHADEDRDLLLVASAVAAERRGRVGAALEALAPLVAPARPRLPRYRWLPFAARLALDADWPNEARAVLAASEGEAAAEVVPGAAAAAADHCRGLLSGDPEPVLRAAGHHRAVGRPVELATALEDAAALLADAGRGAQAAVVYAEAVDGYRALGAHWDLRRAAARMERLGVGLARAGSRVAW